MKKISSKLAEKHDIATLAEALLDRLSAQGMIMLGEPGSVLRDLANVGLAAKGICSIDHARVQARAALNVLANDANSRSSWIEAAAWLRDVRASCKPGSEEHTRLGTWIRELERMRSIPKVMILDNG